MDTDCRATRPRIVDPARGEKDFPIRHVAPLAVTLVLSAVAHAAVSAAVGTAPAELSARGSPPEPVAVTIAEDPREPELPQPEPRPEPEPPEPEREDPEPEPEPTPPSPPPSPEPPSEQRSQQASREQERATREPEPPPPEPAEPDDTEPPPSPNEEEAEPPAEAEPAPTPSRELDIDPRTAALGTFDLPPSGTGEARAGDRDAPAAEGRSADRGDEEAVERRIQQGLARRANERAHTSERPPPDLERTERGGYRWDGPTIGAVIRPDGRVSFDDGAGVSGELGGDPSEGNEPRPGMRFDLNDAFASAAGDDPHYAERHWFLEQTEELRHKLARQQRDGASERASRRLRARLARVWGSSGGSAAERRKEIFRIWDNCSEDGIGRKARRTVEAFVRRRLPQNSPRGYSETELEALNRSRRSEARFRPYAN